MTFRLRPAADPMHLHDWLDSDFTPALEAWSAVWLGAPQVLVTSANVLMARCVDVVSAATTRSEQPGQQRFREFVMGARVDHGQVERVQAALLALAGARRDFAALVRDETGQEDANLFLAT